MMRSFLRALGLFSLALIVSVLLFTACVSNVLAAAVQQVEPTDFTGIGILAVAAVVAAGLIFLRRQNKTKFDAAAHDVQHTVGTGVNTLVTAAGTFIHGASTKLHEFEAHQAPAAPPAIAITPTNPVIPQIIAATNEYIDNASLVATPAPPSWSTDNRSLKA
jgi:uncharacterized membrane protein (DUF485 family)